MPTKLLWKLPGVILAAVSLVMLMTPALGIKFKPWFVEFLRELESWEIKLFFQFITPHILAVIDYLNAAFDWHLKLAEWWHHTFVLQWLLQGSFARDLSRDEGWGDFLFLLIWDGATALAPCVATGTVPLNSLAIILWPSAGFFAFIAGLAAWKAARVDAALLGLLMSAAMSAGGYADTRPMTPIFGLDVPSPGLVMLAGSVFFFGFPFLVIGLIYAARLRDHFITSLGFNIVGAFGFAAALAIAAQFLM